MKIRVFVDESRLKLRPVDDEIPGLMIDQTSLRDANGRPFWLTVLCQKDCCRMVNLLNRRLENAPDSLLEIITEVRGIGVYRRDVGTMPVGTFHDPDGRWSLICKPVKDGREIRLWTRELPKFLQIMSDIKRGKMSYRLAMRGIHPSDPGNGHTLNVTLAEAEEVASIEEGLYFHENIIDAEAKVVLREGARDTLSVHVQAENRQDAKALLRAVRQNDPKLHREPLEMHENPTKEVNMYSS